jgi:hypothetical protein
VSVAALAAACASPGDGDGTGGDDGGIGGVVEIVAEAPADASSGACDVERRVVTTAADTYLALTGSPASSEQDLIDDGFLREPSELFDLTADGTVVPAPAGPCA